MIPSEGLTPMMVQYLQAKQEVPGAIVMFRLGDFYEMFGSDAEAASAILEITLTSREAGKGSKMPMCGVPFHAAEGYIARLVAAGHSVAICDQVEAAIPGKLVKRTITSVVTPGTVTDMGRLDGRVDNFLMAFSTREDQAGAAFLDLMSGSLKVLVCPTRDSARFLSEVHRLNPKEIVLDGFSKEGSLAQAIRESFSSRSAIKEMVLSPGKLAAEILLNHFEEAALKAWGISLHSAEAQALALLFDYLALNRIQGFQHTMDVQVLRPQEFMHLDPKAIANLELVERLSDRRVEGSLLHCLDQTLTPMGARLLRSWLLAPSLELDQIQHRLDEVESLHKKQVLLKELRQECKTIRDLSRLAGRLSLGLIVPRELRTLKDSLDHFFELKTLSKKIDNDYLRQLFEQPQQLEEAAAMIDRALVDEAPSHTRDGEFIRTGFNEEVDALREVSTEGKNWIAALEEKERQKTGIKSLKIGFNKVFGYYLEVTRTNLASVPPEWIRKQTLAGGERYITQDLKEMEEKILGAQDKLLPLEQGLYKELLEQLQVFIGPIQQAAAAVARLDVIGALAIVARDFSLVRPKLTRDPVLQIKGGFHPVVKASLPQGAYIPNNTNLGDDGGLLHVITGPNMGGKSTYMRQVALCLIMAQMGSFVPAKEATVGLADALLTRIGASDDVGQGLSTFMVEMVETSQILASASANSFVLLDEVGRGTSTGDGMAIARAVAEDLAARIRCRTLFATHFHSLGDITENHQSVRNFHVSAEEKDQKMIFRRVLLDGATNRSFGIQVARLAGLPHGVIVRALELMAEEGAQDNPPAVKEESPQLSLFAPAEPHWLAGQLGALDLEALTPREALDLLFRWKTKLDG